MKTWKDKEAVMGVFAENKKKRQEYVDKFYQVWDSYCSEYNLRYKKGKVCGLDFNGEEKQCLKDEESLLGYYLAYYGGLESEIPRAIENDYPQDFYNEGSVASKACSLFYKTACNLKESLMVSDFIVNEYESDKGRYLQFYFITTNGSKEFEDLTNCRSDVKQELLKIYEKQGCQFNEKDFDEECYIQVFGNFAKNGNFEIYLECNHPDIEKEKIYDLKEYLNEEDVGAFWDEVKGTEDWKEFVSANQLSNEETDIEL